MAKSQLEQHIEDIKQNKVLIHSLETYPATNMIVQGVATQNYWVQKPGDLWDYEIEICTVQELLECLASEKQ